MADTLEKVPVCWVRSIDAETVSPVEGELIGQIPDWLEGTLIRNGSGLFEIGETSMNHLFDGFAVLHRFAIKNGKATYQNRILESDVYRESKAANRLILSQFGTIAAPDPCKSLLGRFMSRFEPMPSDEKKTDSCAVNVCYFGDALYTMTETCHMHRIDPNSLDKIGEKVFIKDYVAVNHATAHPHVDEDGTVYNMGSSFGPNGPAYNIIKFPPGDAAFKEAKIVASLPPRWKMYPSYYHSFGITDNYFIFVECPVVFNGLKMMTINLRQQSFSSAMEWFPNERARFMVVERSTGKWLETIYEAPAFFSFHHSNAYEKDGHLIVDMANYEDGSVFSNLSMKSLKENKGDFKAAYYTRFVLPLNPQPPADKSQIGVNLVALEGVKCKSYWMNNQVLFCEPDRISELGVELPRINYKYNGKYYRYAYTVNQANGTSETIKILKFDLETREIIEWEKEGFSVSEPVFVARPGSIDEDDGLILFSALDRRDEKRVLLVILDAANLADIATIQFTAVGTVSKDFHGIFTNDADKIQRY